MSDSPIWIDAIKWHDPLCPQYGQEECNHPMTNVKCRHSGIHCQCELIKRIRADERDKVLKNNMGG